jgi:hypothetical protein
VEKRLNGRVADAFNVVVTGRAQQRVDQNAERQHADGTAKVRISDALKNVFREAQASNEGGGGEPDQHPEQRKGQQRRQRGRMLRRQQFGRDGERGVNAEKDAPDKRRRPGRKGDGQECARAELRHQQLDREHDAADRRIEGGSDAGAGTGPHQRDPLPGRHADQLAECRAQRGADLDDGTFAAYRGAGADRDCRRERLDQRHHRSNHTFLVIDRVHHFGHAMAARFRGEICDQEGDKEAADNRNQDDIGAPRAWRRENAGVVIDRGQPEKCDVMNQANQGAEHHRAKSGDQTDNNGNQR